jgi:hypothetical protein
MSGVLASIIGVEMAMTLNSIIMASVTALFAMKANETVVTGWCYKNKNNIDQNNQNDTNKE